MQNGRSWTKKKHYGALLKKFILMTPSKHPPVLYIVVQLYIVQVSIFQVGTTQKYIFYQQIDHYIYFTSLIENKNFRIKDYPFLVSYTIVALWCTIVQCCTNILCSYVVQTCCVYCLLDQRCLFNNVARHYTTQQITDIIQHNK